VKKIMSLFLLLFLIQVQAVQAADWMVKVTSNKETYVVGEEAVFNVELTKNGKWVKNKSLIIKASFPKSGRAVSLMKIAKGRYAFNVFVDGLSEKQRLKVKVFRKSKKGKKKILATGYKRITVISSYENAFTIKEGKYTSNNKITLEIDSNTSYEIAVSEDPMFTNCQWQGYAPTIIFYISNEDGGKTIYVKFRHKVTQEEQVESAQIILDTEAPGIFTLSPFDGSVVTGKTN